LVPDEIRIECAVYWIGRTIKLFFEGSQGFRREHGNVRISPSLHLDGWGEPPITTRPPLITRNQHEVEEPRLPFRPLSFVL
jgi:hypothetical protein